MDGKKSTAAQGGLGVFFVQDKQARIVHTQEFQNDRKITQALQVGPGWW